jgi:hypothetical protein
MMAIAMRSYLADRFSRSTPCSLCGRPVSECEHGELNVLIFHEGADAEMVGDFLVVKNATVLIYKKAKQASFVYKKED